MTFVDDVMRRLREGTGNKGAVHADVLKALFREIKGPDVDPIDLPEDAEGQEATIRLIWNVAIGSRSPSKDFDSTLLADLLKLADEDTFLRTLKTLRVKLGIAGKVGSHLSRFPDVNASSGALWPEDGFPSKDHAYVASSTASMPHVLTISGDAKTAIAARILSRSFRYPDGRIVAGLEDFLAGGLTYRMLRDRDRDLTQILMDKLHAELDRRMDRVLSARETVVIVPKDDGTYVQITPAVSLAMLGAIRREAYRDTGEVRTVKGDVIHWGGSQPQNAAVVSSNTKGYLLLLDGFPPPQHGVRTSVAMVRRTGTLIREPDARITKALLAKLRPDRFANMKARGSIVTTTRRQVGIMTAFFGREDLGLTDVDLENLDRSELAVHRLGFDGATPRDRARFVERIAARLAKGTGLNTESAMFRRNLIEAVDFVMRLPATTRSRKEAA